MKKIIFLIALILLGTSASQAQTDSSFNLKKCIDYAIKNSPTLKNSELDQYIAKAKIGEIRALLLPQINGNANITDNPLLQKQFFANNNPLLESLGSSSTSASSSPAIPPVSTTKYITVYENFFQLKTTGIANVTANQTLFNASYLVGLQAAKTYKELWSKSYTLNKIQIIENVTKAFYLVLITKERLQLLYANVARLDTSLRQTRIMRENGQAEKIDVDRIEVSYNNMVTEARRAENLYIISFTTLKFQMGMPFEQTLEVSGNMAELNRNINIAKEERLQNYSQRIEYSTLETQRQYNYQNLKSIRTGYLPYLSLTGTAGYFRMDVNVSQLIRNPWYAYGSYGLNFNMPIFDGFSKYYRSQQAKLEVKKTENSLRNAKNAIDMQIQQSGLTLNNNLQSLQSQKRNLELSTEVARIAKIKYQEGVGSNLELTTAETSLKESQTNYYNALYDVMIADVDYQKSLGLLNNNY